MVEITHFQLSCSLTVSERFAGKSTISLVTHVYSLTDHNYWVQCWKVEKLMWERQQMPGLCRDSKWQLKFFPGFLSSFCDLTKHIRIHVLSYFNVRAVSSCIQLTGTSIFRMKKMKMKTMLPRRMLMVPLWDLLWKAGTRIYQASWNSLGLGTCFPYIAWW